jgi:hypothetical protein
MTLVRRLMKLSEMLNRGVEAKKDDDIPGSVDAILDEECPVCGKKMRLYKPCCGANNGYKGCRCGYKVIL